MKKLFAYLFCSALLISCTEEKENPQVSISNTLDFDRKEIVTIPFNRIDTELKKSPQAIRIKKSKTGGYVRTQLVDLDQDATYDQLLFEAEVAANETVNYLLLSDSTATEPESEAVAYSRFVPERTDDYTWENDKVAFRTYGPTGQKEALAGVPGSTLSSGIDLWLKRTERSIINDWYAGYKEDPMYYHTDRGEGYDPYHVGVSRGTGGIGIWEKDTLYVSRNFTSYKTIAEGPLRTIFELSYAPWSPYEVEETKRISLDVGSNFSKYEIRFSAPDSIPNYAAGITLHENEGTYKTNESEGWASYWESIDDTKVGEGLVVKAKDLDSIFARESQVADQSNLLVVLKPKDTITYYAGFAWEKSGQIDEVQDWEEMLDKQVKIIENPLQVAIK